MFIMFILFSLIQFSSFVLLFNFIRQLQFICMSLFRSVIIKNHWILLFISLILGLCGNWIEIAYGTKSGSVRVIVQHPETVGHGPQLFQTFTVHTSPVTKVIFNTNWYKLILIYFITLRLLYPRNTWYPFAVNIITSEHGE